MLRTVLLALLLASAAAGPAGAASFTVNVVADDQSDTTCDATCPLSAAIDDANGDGEPSDITFAVGSVDASSGGFPTTITQPVVITGGAQRVSILGPNTGSGVGLDFQVNGGTPSLVRNLVVGDFATGIWQRGTAPLQVQASLIGIDADNVDRSNGVGIDASGGGRIEVGGTTSAERNVISDNSVDIRIAAGSNHVIEGNYLGTSADGLTSPNVSGTSIEVGGSGTVSGVRIGGATAASRNVIAGASTGIFLAGQSTGTRIENNFIGVDATGQSALGFTGTGVYLQSVDGNVVGSPGAGNVIAGAGGSGIQLDTNSEDNLIQGNLIGTLADGTGSTATGNRTSGITIAGPNSANNKIGGTGTGEGNTIAFNGLFSFGGVVLCCDSHTEVSGNELLGNVGATPIDLGQNNVADANDEGDADVNADVFGFANDMQNAPVIATATGSAGSTTVGGSLESLANRSYRIEFFGGPGCGSTPATETEANEFLGFATVTTNALGLATFGGVALPGFAGTGVRATATDLTLGHTSELSSCVVRSAATADVSLSISHAPATVQAGQPVTFSFLVSNAGPSTATGALTGSIAGANVTAVSPPPGIDCSASSGNGISCSGAVPAGGGGTVAVTAVPPAAGTATAQGTVSAPEDGSTGNNSAADSVTVTAAPQPVVTAEPTAQPTAPPTGQPAPSATPEPEIGETIAAAPEEGTVLVKRPGSGEYVPLRKGEPIPVGTVVDARQGRVALTAETPGGQTQTADFFDGRFKVTQQDSGLTELALQGPLCKAGASAAGPLAETAAKRKKRRRRATRKLWGDGSGDFRTRGRYGTATVQGTRWLTEDRCDGTRVRVARGTVKVRDLVRKKNVTVKAPRSYLARPKR